MKKSLHPDDEMAMRIAYLIAGFIRQTLTPEEHDELDRWVEESDENMILFEELTDEKNIKTTLEKMQEKNEEGVYSNLKRAIPFVQEKRVFKIWAYAVAASIILLVSGLYFYSAVTHQPAEKLGMSKQFPPSSDISPGTIGAILVLDKEHSILLDSAKNGSVLQEGNTWIRKTNQGISYELPPDNKSASGIVTNMLHTPRGRTYRLELSDGTKVWLNAESSIQFPTAFSGGERKVLVSGEVYFEVAHNQQMPFKVQVGEMDVEVLGTHFNINAFANEQSVKTTLLEGKVKIKIPGAEITLSPGEQADLSRQERRIIVNRPDIEQTMGWKEGIFVFRNAGIEAIMRQVIRWYDAEVIYEGKVESHFNATISRDLPVSKLLRLLEETGRVHFQISGKTIKVSP